MDQKDDDATTRTEPRVVQKDQIHLDKYDLPTDLNDIKTHTPNEWKRKVKFAVESESLARLKQECYKKDGNERQKASLPKSTITNTQDHQTKNFYK